MLLSIFSGIEVLFFILGVMTALSGVGLVWLLRRSLLNWKSASLLIPGILFLVFAIAWSVSSVLEGEPRAASMGMVVFGLPSLILLAFGRKVIMKSIH